MGMFDYFRCRYPLPIEGAAALEFQTKDTSAQMLDLYELRHDGSLWHQAYDIEDRCDPNAEGVARFLGCATCVNKRWERDTMTGEVRFYTSNIADEWFEFAAHFVGGQLERMEVIEPQTQTTRQRCSMCRNEPRRSSFLAPTACSHR